MADLTLQLSPAAIGSPAYHDLVLTGTGDLSLTSGVAAIEQAIKQALLSCQLSWFIETSYGLPYYDELLGFKNSGITPAFESEIQNVILSVPGVIGLLDWSAAFTRTSRTLAIVFSAQVVGGTVVYDDSVTFTGQ